MIPNDDMYDANDTGPGRAGFRLGGNRSRLFKGGGGGGDVTNTTKVEPPPQLAPYLAPFMQQASAAAMTPYEAYGGQKVAGLNLDQYEGINRTRDTANTMVQDAGKSKNYMLDTMQGGNANPLLGMDNPFLQKAIDANMGDVTRHFNDSVANNTDAAMSRAGAFGGSAWQQAQSANADELSKNLGNIGNQMRMQDYGLQAQLGESDATRKMQAAQMLPALNQYGIQSGQMLSGIGGQRQQQQQAELDSQLQDWLDQQNHPYQSLDTMGNAIRTIMGSGSSSSSTGPNPNQTNMLGSALGGAAAGGALAGMSAGAVGGPMGMAVGAGLGLLGAM